MHCSIFYSSKAQAKIAWLLLNKKTCIKNAGFKSVVSPTGFEPVTASLEGRCSIQLSYEPTLQKMVAFAAANIQIILKNRINFTIKN